LEIPAVTITTPSAGLTVTDVLQTGCLVARMMASVVVHPRKSKKWSGARKHAQTRPKDVDHIAESVASLGNSRTLMGQQSGVDAGIGGATDLGKDTPYIHKNSDQKLNQ